MSSSEFSNYLEMAAQRKPALKAVFKRVMKELKNLPKDSVLEVADWAYLLNVDQNQIKHVFETLVVCGVLKRVDDFECGVCGIGFGSVELKNCPGCEIDLQENEPTKRTIYMNIIDFQTPSVESRVVAAKFLVVTALAEEAAAVECILDDCVDFVTKDSVLKVGSLRGKNGVHEVLLLSLTNMGNNIASAEVAKTLDRFENLNTAIMVGIAGGMPCVKNSVKHVRLGDIVVVGTNGVVQADNVKNEGGTLKYRSPPRAPNAIFVQAANRLKVKALREPLKYISVLQTKFPPQFARPSSPDLLFESGIRVDHPHDPLREPKIPRVFIGPIAATNTLLKDPVLRDKWRDELDVLATEMEGSGVADASWLGQKQYFIVRGVCDYCDSNKNDDWHYYAAAVAAAYFHTLMAEVPV